LSSRLYTSTRPLPGRACLACMAQPGRSSSPSCTSWLASTAPPVPSQPGGGGHRLPTLESTRCPSRGGRRLRASPVLCFSTCTRSRRRRCGSHAPASPTTCSMRGRESSPPAHTAVRGPLRDPDQPQGRGDTRHVLRNPTGGARPNPPACVAVETQALRLTTVEASSNSGAVAQTPGSRPPPNGARPGRRLSASCGASRRN